MMLRSIRNSAAVVAAAHVRSRHYVAGPTPACLNSSGNSRSVAEEDRLEMERERVLRERFAQKVQQGVPNDGNSAGQQGGGYSSPGNGGSFGPQFMSSTWGPHRMFRLFFFMSAFMFLFFMAPLANRNSPVYTMQGLAWWQLPIPSAAYYLLLRVIYPTSQQNSIKVEFEAASKMNPHLTFHEYMAHQHPDMFQGYRTTQPEAIAAVAACMSSAKDFKFAQSVVRAARRVKDPKQAVDNVVDALRRDFPMAFQ